MSRVYTPEFRVSFPNVFKPRKNDLSGKEEYGVVALFPKGTDLTPLKNAAAEAAKKKWGDKIPNNLKSPFRDQGDREKDGVLPNGYEKGATFINLKSTTAPGVVDLTKGNRPIENPADFYAGCYAVATIEVFAYDQKGNRGISFGLGNIQKTRDGEPLGGRAPAAADFKPVEMSADQPANSLFA